MGKVKTLEGEVIGVFIGDQKTVSRSVPELVVSFEGIVGDRHYGFTKLADARESYYPRGTQIRNMRQFSAVSDENLKEIAKNMAVPRMLPEWLGANLSIRGIPYFSKLPPLTRIVFPDNAVLIVCDENEPCTGPGKVIEKEYGVPAHRFPREAYNLRGLVGVVERPGVIRVNDKVQVEIFKPTLYPGYRVNVE